ncbi:hypothetical protein FAGAP_5015 [Fusarium agapanthi]|uniref:WSC domain-containing protein n=1 Tax=Fusarium agapanthi TaxID=1803897 RepID=A0A9P5EFH4_9HYPO|nr:hypothetical protein FAGAP_5015 [Fusarium agapanthi]
MARDTDHPEQLTMLVLFCLQLIVHVSVFTRQHVVELAKRGDLSASNTLPCSGYAACAALIFGNSKRDVESPCAFRVLVDSVVVLQEPITGTGTLNLSTNPFPFKSDYDVRIEQGCGNEFIPAILNGVTVVDGPGRTSTLIPSIVIATSNSVETGTATTESAIETTGAFVTTNSEGETITVTEPTGTASSGAPGFTTNSEGETVFPTETAATNSNGETVSPTTTAGTASSSSATSVPGFPGSVLDFTLFECVGSTAGFPKFTSVETSERMDLDVCGGLCAGRAYFGVYDTTCYCGDELGDDASRVSLGERLRARQNVPSNRLLTVYAAPQDVVVTDSVTQTVTEEQTVVTKFTTTVTGASTTAVEVITTALVCVNGQCFPGSPTVYFFVELNGSDCDGQWVFISVPCPGGHKYIPQYCSGGNCANLQVYKPQQCHDWYNYDSFFVASDCGSNAPGSESTYPSTITLSDASKQVMDMQAFLAVFIALF